MSSHQLKSWSFIHLLMETQKDKNVHGQMPRINDQGTALAAMAFYLLFKGSVWRRLNNSPMWAVNILCRPCFRKMYKFDLVDEDTFEQWRNDAMSLQHVR
eukprot:662250_1